MSHNGSKLDSNEIERVAYRLWEERGRPIGSADDDWFRAKQELEDGSAAAPQAVAHTSLETTAE